MSSDEIIIPEGAKQLTADGELYKIVLEEGNKENRLSNRKGTKVAVYCQLYSLNGFIDDSTAPRCWIVGYEEEAKISMYRFLPIVVGTMAEKETCKVILTKKYIFGAAVVTNMDFEIDNSKYFEATVHLYRAEGYDYDGNLKNLIALPGPTPEDKEAECKETTHKQEEPKKEDEKKEEEEQKKDEENTKESSEKVVAPKEETKKNETKHKDPVKEIQRIAEETKKKKEEIAEMEKKLGKKKMIFALIQLNKAKYILEVENKPAAARKEYNRARMAWGGMVDLSQAPEEYEDERLAMPEDEFKNYIQSEALLGNAKTFLAIKPPNVDKAIQYLKDAIVAFPGNGEAKFILGDITGANPESLTQKKVEEEKKEKDFSGEINPEDPDLVKPQFWATATCDFSVRMKFSLICKEKGHEFYKMNDFKNAMKYYNRARIPFTKKSYVGVDAALVKQANEIICQCYNNCALCYLEKGDPKTAITNADLAIVIERKELSDNEDIYLKSLYRKAIGYVRLDMQDEANEVTKEMKTLKNGAQLIANVENEKKRIMEHDQKNEEFVFKKMTGKL